MESVLKDIWCRLLEVPSVSNTSNFFLEGGDSTKLVSLTLEINQRFSIDVPLMTVFEAQNFGNLLAEVSSRIARTHAKEAL